MWILGLEGLTSNGKGGGGVATPSTLSQDPPLREEGHKWGDNKEKREKEEGAQ